MSIAKNYFYNLIYQFLLIVLPFTVIPYITRALGMEGMGVAAFTNSITQYFVLLGMLGIMLYGNVQIAYVREDKEKLNNTFWEIYSLQIIMTFISLVIFIIYCLFYSEKYKIIFLLQGLLIVANFFDVSWFFIGIEDFKKTVSRSILAKIVSVFCVFLFVKKPDDVWIYVFLMGFMTLVGNLIMCGFLKNYVRKPLFKKLEFKKHLIPCLSFFIPNLAVRVYFIADKTILGFLAPISETGLFDVATKVVTMLMPFIASFSAVMTPRISNIFAKGDNELIKSYMNKSFEFAFYIAFPVCFGLLAIADSFTSWFLGESFSKAALIIQICSFAIIIKTIGSITGSQLLISIGRQRQYTISVLVGLVVCIGFNLALIPSLQSIGASIVFLITSFVVSGLQVFYCRDYLHFNKKLYLELSKSLISALIMCVGVTAVSSKLASNPITTLIQIITGGVIYSVCSYLLKCSMFFQIIEKIIQLTKAKINKEDLARVI